MPSPIPPPRHIALIAFDGVQVLDVTGPAGVFASANEAAGRECYRVHILSPGGGAVTGGSGVRLLTDAAGELDPSMFDTVLVGGGNKRGLVALCADAAFGRWLLRACTAARR